MRKLVLILVASIAVITFIRAFDYSEGNFSIETTSDGIKAEVPTGVIVQKVVQ